MVALKYNLNFTVKFTVEYGLITHCLKFKLSVLRGFFRYQLGNENNYYKILDD